MGDSLSKYDKYVRESILANNPFGIMQVQCLESIRSTYFDRNEYAIVQQLIKKKDIEGIKQLAKNPNLTSEYLDVILFKDQSGRPYLVTIYDNTDLEQDPQVIEIYSL